VKDFLLELRATDKVKKGQRERERERERETDKQQTNKEAFFFFETQLTL